MRIEEDDDSHKVHFIFFLILLALFIACIICHLVFYIRMIKVDKRYKCSDSLTNELIEKERLLSKNTTLFTEISFIIDLSFFVMSCFGVLIGFITDKFIKPKNNENKNDNNGDEKKDVKYETSADFKEIPLNTYYSNPTDSPLPNPS